METEKLLTDDQINRLLSDAQNGAIIQGFCTHPGFKLYQQALELVLADKKNTWLKGSDEEAKLERIRAQGVQKSLDILKQFLLNGSNASRILRDNDVAE